MRRAFVFLIALAIAVPALGQDDHFFVNFKKKAAVAAPDECAGYLICQNFEGSGYDNVSGLGGEWTETPASGCTIDEDYTSTALRGSQSFYSNYNAWDECNTAVSFTPSGSAYAFFRFRRLNNSSTKLPFVQFRTSGDAVVASVQLRSTTVAVVYNGSSEGGDSSALDNSTTYYMWFEYTKGTGANGIARLYVATDGTKPVVTSETTFGDSTTDAGKFVINTRGTTQEFIFDQVYVQTSGPIGNVPQ